LLYPLRELRESVPLTDLFPSHDDQDKALKAWQREMFSSLPEARESVAKDRQLGLQQ
jgi:hypothetical protein